MKIEQYNATSIIDNKKVLSLRNSWNLRWLRIHDHRYKYTPIVCWPYKNIFRMYKRIFLHYDIGIYDFNELEYDERGLRSEVRCHYNDFLVTRCTTFWDLQKILRIFTTNTSLWPIETFKGSVRFRICSG